MKEITTGDGLYTYCNLGKDKTTGEGVSLIVKADSSQEAYKLSHEHLNSPRLQLGLT